MFQWFKKEAQRGRAYYEDLERRKESCARLGICRRRKGRRPVPNDCGRRIRRPGPGRGGGRRSLPARSAGGDVVTIRSSGGSSEARWTALSGFKGREHRPGRRPCGAAHAERRAGAGGARRYHHGEVTTITEVLL